MPNRGAAWVLRGVIASCALTVIAGCSAGSDLKLTPTAAASELPAATLVLESPPVAVNSDHAWEAAGDAFAIGDLVVGYFHVDGDRMWLQAVDGRTGEVRWRLPGVIPDWYLQPRSPYSAFVGHDGGATLYLTGRSEDDKAVASLYGVDVATGQPIFETELSTKTYGSTVISVTSSAVVVDTGVGFSTFDPRTGELLATGELAENPRWVTETTVVDTGAGDSGDQLVVYDLRTGKQVWTSPNDLTALVVHYAGRHLVVYSGLPDGPNTAQQKTVIADARTGEILQESESRLDTCAGESNTTFVCSSAAGELIGLDAKTGEQRWITEPADESLAIDNQAVTAGNALYLWTGEVVELDTGTVIADGASCVLRVGNGFVVSRCVDAGGDKFRVFAA